MATWSRGWFGLLKVLVIEEQGATSHLIASVLPRRVAEVIWCRDVALAEVATDLTEFDLILVDPRTTGIAGIEGLAIADFLAARNAGGKTAFLLPAKAVELRSVVRRRGTFETLATPASTEDVLHLFARIGLPLAQGGVA